MRKLIMYCDRCHKEFEKWNHKRDEKIGIAELIYDDGYDPYLDNQLDLCESCYKELEKWWDCGKEEKETCCKDTNDPTTDTINRQAVIDTIYTECSGTKLDIDFVKVLLLQKAIKALPSATPQEPRKGYLSIDDVMSVFDDFTCGVVDEDVTEIFLEMLKDKAEIE